MKYLLLFLIALSINGCAHGGSYYQSNNYNYDRSSYSEWGFKPRYNNNPSVYYVQQPQVIYVERYQPRNSDYFRMERDRYQDNYHHRRHR